MIETERAFLVRGRIPDGLKKMINQAYLLAIPGLTVRLRTVDAGSGECTVKLGRGRRRLEVGLPFPASAAAAFIKRSSRVVRKTRTQVGPWEFDDYEQPKFPPGVFRAELEGDYPLGGGLPPLPDSLSHIIEVTGTEEFSNAALACTGFPAQMPK